MQNLFRPSLIPLLLWVFTLITTPVQAIWPGEELPEDAGSAWTDSVFRALSLEERIGQLIFVRANLNGAYLQEVDAYVRDLGVGGIVWFKAEPTEVARITAGLQSMARVPLFVAIDAEWGLGMRMDQAWSFPRQMTLGALQDVTLIRDMGLEIAKQCRALGIQINFAPVVDINSNPRNPVINSRSFGQLPAEVSRRGQAYMDGLHEGGVMAVAKHFPGHGDTDQDSHKTLPVIRHSQDTILRYDLEPFRQLIHHGADAVMTAHLEVPAFEPDTGIPFTLSETAIHRLLRKELRFRGLIITDALEMKGVTEHFSQAEIAVRALAAGNDILLMPEDVPAAFEAIKAALADGRLREKDIDRAVRRVLKMKEEYRPAMPMPWNGTNWDEALYNRQCMRLSEEMFDGAVTLLRDRKGTIPLQPGSRGTYATLAINTDDINEFQHIIDHYAPFDHYNIPAGARREKRESVLESLQDYRTVFLSLHGISTWPKNNYGLDEETLSLVRDIASTREVILVLFGNPYALNHFNFLEELSGIVVAYEDGELPQRAAAQVIGGALGAQGILPVSIQGFPAGSGINTLPLKVLSYSSEALAGIQPGYTARVDSLAMAGIRAGAYPSCQILAAKDGKVFYHKSFGYHTYDSIVPAQTTDIYDLASVTKVAATTLAIMKLSEEGRLDLSQQLGHYLPGLRGTNKEGLVIRDILAHQAGLKAWVPFYKDLLRDEASGIRIFTSTPEGNYRVKVASERYMENRYIDSLYQTIEKTPLNKRKDYLYSDLGYYYLLQVIEKLSGTTLNQYVDEQFYRPLGLGHTAFRPTERFCLNNIVPSMQDTSFRRTLLQGDVHDPGAAMLGGVGGHAGLFSSTSDLAVIMQMLLNGGRYGQRQYLEPETVREFTRQQFPLTRNRRGLGFDKPDPGDRLNGPGAPSASMLSFGHSGYTGTYAWADPAYGLVYIFLSNRTWPYDGENKLARMNLRTEILETFYKSLR